MKALEIKLLIGLGLSIMTLLAVLWTANHGAHDYTTPSLPFMPAQAPSSP